MTLVDNAAFDRPRADVLPYAAAARWIHYPVLFGQGPWVRARALAMPEPGGLREGEMGEGAPLRLLITGDSSAAGVGVRTQDEALLGQLSTRLARRYRVSYQLVARTGNTTGMTARMLAAFPPQQADVVLTGLGVNDITGGIPIRTWLKQTRALLDQIQQQTGAKLIIVSGLPPVHQFPLLPNPLRWVLGAEARRRDAALREMLTDHPFAKWMTLHLDLGPHNMSEDGFHPGPEVYREWARVADGILRAHDI